MTKRYGVVTEIKDRNTVTVITPDFDIIEVKTRGKQYEIGDEIEIETVIRWDRIAKYTSGVAVASLILFVFPGIEWNKTEPVQVATVKKANHVQVKMKPKPGPDPEPAEQVATKQEQPQKENETKKPKFKKKDIEVADVDQVQPTKPRESEVEKDTRNRHDEERDSQTPKSEQPDYRTPDPKQPEPEHPRQRQQEPEKPQEPQQPQDRTPTKDIPIVDIDLEAVNIPISVKVELSR